MACGGAWSARFQGLSACSTLVDIHMVLRVLDYPLQSLEDAIADGDACAELIPSSDCFGARILV